MCISDVDKKSRHDHTYKCLSCKKEMIPRIGETNAPHFAHKAHVDCNGETYLHNLAKYCIERKFNSQQEFEIVIYQKVWCANYRTCKLSVPTECYETSPQKYGLKKIGYDKCEVEKSVLNGQFKADVLISESTGKNPILVEIWVSHKSTDDKRNSGLRIIEIHIENESQIEELIAHPIGYRGSSYGYEYINFNKESPRTTNYKRRFVNYFCIDAERRPSIGKKTCDIQKNGKKSDVFKMVLHNDDWEWPYIYGYQLEIALYHCLKRQIKTCYCPICYYSGTSNVDVICKRYKTKGTPHYPVIENVIDCQYFSINRRTESIVKEALKDTDIIELN